MVAQSLNRLHRTRDRERENNLQEEWTPSSDTNQLTDDDATIILPLQEPQNNESPAITQQLNDDQNEENNTVCITQLNYFY